MILAVDVFIIRRINDVDPDQNVSYIDECQEVVKITFMVVKLNMKHLIFFSSKLIPLL